MKYGFALGALLWVLGVVSPLEAWGLTEDIQQFWEAAPLATLKPRVLQTRMMTYAGTLLQVEDVSYQAGIYRNKPVRIFGFFAFPKGIVRPIPGLLVVHGGGGYADLPRTLDWAARGYAVLSIDLPGKGENRERSRSTGPGMTVDQILSVKNHFSENYLFHAVNAARNGISYLVERPEVDLERLGLLGLSWGGVISLMTNGVDPRLKTAIVVFGSGFIFQGSTWQERFHALPLEDQLKWTRTLDPQSYLPDQHGSILFLTSTNDQCYYLPNFLRTYDWAPVKKALAIVPNLNHQLSPDVKSDLALWLSASLRGGAEFPRIETFDVEQKGKRIVIPLKVRGPSPIQTVNLYYSSGTLQGWTLKKWRPVKAVYREGYWWATLPTRAVKPEIYFYASAKDVRGAVVSTPVRSAFRVSVNGKTTILLSSTIRKLHAHDVRAKSLAALFSATADWDHEKRLLRLHHQGKLLRFFANLDKAYIGDEEKSLEEPIRIEDESMILPFGFVAEALGYRAHYSEMLYALREVTPLVTAATPIKRKEKGMTRVDAFEDVATLPPLAPEKKPVEKPLKKVTPPKPLPKVIVVEVKAIDKSRPIFEMF